MSEQVPDWFVAKYNDTVLQLAQQRERRLSGATSGGGMFVGETIFFPRMGAVEMYDSPRFAQLAIANGQMDMVSVTAKPKFVVFGIWDPDKAKINVNLAAEYGRSAAMAGFRAEDKMVVDCLNLAAANGVVSAPNVALGGAVNTANITTIGDYNTVADLDAIADGIATLGSLEMFEGEDLCMVMPFKIKMNNALDPYMALNNVRGNVPWENVKWATYERLNDNNGAPITSAGIQANTVDGVDMFLFCRNAVSSDYNNEMTKIEERVGGSLTDILGNWFQAGACAKEAAGIVRIKSKYDFNLMRKAIPIADLGPL